VSIDTIILENSYCVFVCFLPFAELFIRSIKRFQVLSVMAFKTHVMFCDSLCVFPFSHRPSFVFTTIILTDSLLV
jgi:hypothetical protein